jgi:hypothetical protein
LVAHGKVLKGQVAMAAEKEGEESKVEQESDHRAGIVSGSGPTDQPLARRPRFWRRTGFWIPAVWDRVMRTGVNVAYEPAGVEMRALAVDPGKAATFVSTHPEGDR